MKTQSHALILLTVWQGLAVAQGYYSERTPGAPGEYRKTAHSTSARSVSPLDKPKAIQMIDAVVEAVKKAYPQPTGATVGPYAGFWEDYRGPSEFLHGPYTIHVTIPFYDLLKTRSGKIEPTGEYASEINIWINSIRYLLQGNRVGNGNDLVFRSPVPGIAVNGFPKYNNMILILLAGKSLPWRPATKQEYLQNFIIAAKSSFNGRSTTPGERQNVAELEQYLAKMSPSEKREIAYLQKAQYNRSELSSGLGYSKWTGFRSPSDPTADQLVIIDENYYDKSLPRSSYQVIVLDRRSARSSAANALPLERKEYREHFDRMNAIVHNSQFLPDLQRLLGKSGLDL